MRGLNELNWQFCYTGDDEKMTALDDSSCILINHHLKQQKFKVMTAKDFPDEELILINGDTVLFKNDDKIILVKDEKEYQLFKSENNDRFQRIRPIGSQRNSAED